MADPPERTFSGEHLVRVVVVKDGLWLQGWKVQSLDLFQDGFVVRAWRAGEWDGYDDSDLWEITDDLATAYQWTGGSEDTDEQSTRRAQEFVPGVAEGASVLTVKGKHETIQIALQED